MRQTKENSRMYAMTNATPRRKPDAGKRMALFGAMALALTSAAKDASFIRVGDSTTWNTASYWLDGYVGASGDDIFLTNTVNKSTVLYFPKSAITLRTVQGTPGHRLLSDTSGEPSTAGVTVWNAAEFAGLWQFCHGNALHLTNGLSSASVPTVTEVNSYGGVQLYADAPSAVVSNLMGTGMVRSRGKGQLKIVRSSGFSSVSASAGSIAFGGEPTSAEVSVETVLAKAQCHFDATVSDTMIVSDGRVTSWKSTIGAWTCDRPSCSKYGQLPGPVIVDNYQNGNPVLDFGPRLATSGDVSPATTGTSAFLFPSRNVYAKAYFIVAADRAEHPLEGQYQDIIGDHADTRWARRGGGELYAGSYVDAATDEAHVYVNGNRVTPSYPLGGTDLKVIAIKSRCGEIGTYCPIWSIAWKNGGIAGGLRVGEVIMFNVVLTDAEVDAVNRYLMSKWLPSARAAKRQLDTLVLGTSVTNVSVASGVHAMGQLMTVDGKLTKTGSGTLKTEVLASTAGTAIDIDVKGGDIALGAGIPTVGRIATDPLHHFDASDGTGIITNAEGGVTRWNDTRGTDYPAMVTCESFKKGATVMPCAKPTVEENALNGLPVVDFGALVDGTPTESSATNRYANSSGMKISPDETISRVREGFYVVRKKSVLAFPLGSTGSYDFHCQTSGGLLHQAYGAEGLVGAIWTADGLPITPYDYNNGTEKFHLLHFVGATKVRVTTFAIDRSEPHQCGGCKIAEVVLYDRPLTETERLETELKLLQKWFGKTAHPLTEKVKSVTYSDSVAHTLATERDLDLAELKVGGGFTKTGAGDLTVGTLSGATDLAVAEGSLTVREPHVAVLGKAAFHVDASDANSLIFAKDDNGDTYVQKWSDVRTNGVYATAHHTPRYVESDCNGLPVISMGNYDYSSTMSGSGFNWSKTINVKEAYMVLAQNGSYSQNDNYPFVLTCTSAYDFHRSGNGAFFSTTYAPNFKDEKFWVDLEEKDNSYQYTGNNYLVLGIVSKAGTTSVANSFCVERTVASGGMKYGEVLVFEEELTSEERLQVRRYLLKKWRNLDLAVTQPSFGAVSVASGASLSLGYAGAGVAQLSGGGTIAGNVTLGDNGVIMAAFAADGTLSPLTVNGTLALPASGKVIVTSAAVRRMAAGSYPIVVAPSLKAGPLAWTIEASDEILRCWKLTLAIKDGQLVLNVRKPGLTLIIR